jgi:hypothetical protein
MPAQIDHVRFDPDSGSARRYRQGRASVAHAAEGCSKMLPAGGSNGSQQPRGIH